MSGPDCAHDLLKGLYYSTLGPLKSILNPAASVSLLNKKSVHAQLPATVPHFTQHKISSSYHGLLGLPPLLSLAQLSLFPWNLSPSNINVLIL